MEAGERQRPDYGRRAFGASPKAAWVPGPRYTERSRLLSAMRAWKFDDLDALHAAAVDDPQWFWAAAAEDLGLTFSKPWASVLDLSRGKQFPRWFTGGELNVADLCAARHAANDELADKPAVVFEGDDGRIRSLTYRELGAEVAWFAAALAGQGVKRGDRVVLFLPMVPEAVVAYLACAHLGAVSVPAFTGFGPEGVAARARDSGAVAVVTADGTTRRGKLVALKSTADEALESVPSVHTVVVVRHLGHEIPLLDGRDIYYDELPRPLEHVPSVQVESNDPLTIIYTSGTTGAPKGIVHSHAGFLLKAAVDFGYGFDVHSDDVIAWIADMGWMLGPLLIMSGLQLGATIVLVEGVPNYPEADRVWAVANRHRVTIQGIAPTAARTLCAEAKDVPNVESVRAFASTGEAWDEPTWRWLFETVGKGERPIINYSGGTETGGGILIAYPFLPADVAAFNGPLIGMDVAVADAVGEPVVEATGELTVRNTWPGMTNSFWMNDDRYLQTYWERWDGVWLHGDLASRDAHGAWRIHGRSDDTIKVSGRRVGPAELESALLKDPRVVEAAVIGVPDEQRGQRVVAFVVLSSEPAIDEDDVRATAIHNVGRSFAPVLHIVSSLPKTKNGKIMRRAIRSQHLDLETGDLSSLDPSTPLDVIPRLADVD